MNTIKIHENDNVAVVTDGDLKGHKIALSLIKQGENVIKYGYPIGFATEDIQPGSHVHVHNIKTNLAGNLEYKYTPSLPTALPSDSLNFQGYVRENGKVGIRNEIWIINTVGCVNKTSEILANEAMKLYGKDCDGIFNFVHPFGCSQLGDDLKTTQLILKGLINHPNAAGVLVLGLGCENNNISVFQKIIGEVNHKRVKFMNAQDYDNEIEHGLDLIKELVEYSKSFKRSLCSISDLTIGLKCGGSDGFSGITANPLIGHVSDIIINNGGSTILTEVPEMFGAETILMNRCINKKTFEKTVNMINNFKDYFTSHNQVIYENPSPGNKNGGISTLEDKSLGCVQKSGSAAVVDVLNIGESIKNQGLNLLTGPGNDIVAITNLVASGCQIILFSTGRGTPVGAPVPTIKISTNSDLYSKKPHWIDFNAGEILNNKNLDDKLMDYIIDVANGRKTNNEKNGYREISIFKDGVIL